MSFMHLLPHTSHLPDYNNPLRLLHNTLLQFSPALHRHRRRRRRQYSKIIPAEVNFMPESRKIEILVTLVVADGGEGRGAL